MAKRDSVAAAAQESAAPPPQTAPVDASEERLPTEHVADAAQASASPAEEPEERSEAEKKKDLRKKAVTAGVALFTSASVLVGGLFPSPDAILAPEQPTSPITISQNDNDNDLDGDGGDGSSEEQSEEEEEEQAAEQAGVRERTRRWLLGLPLAVRVFVLVPMWAVGWAIWTVASGLWSMLLGPIAGKALGWLFLLAALTGAVVLGAKTIFPDLPLKKLLNKRTFWGVGIGALVLGLADATIPLFWDGYDQVSLALRAVGVAAVSGTVLFVLIRRVLKQQKKELAAASAAPAPGPKALGRKEILAIADSAKTRD